MVKKTLGYSIIPIIALFFCLNPAVARNDALGGVHLFQNFFKDTPISEVPYLEGAFQYEDYEHATGLRLEAQGGYSITPKFEIEAGLGIINYDPEHGDDETGLSDLLISGRYDLSGLFSLPPGGTKFAAGGYFTLPTGDEDVGEDKTDFGLFGAIRHPYTGGPVLTATLGIDSIEVIDRHGDDDRETSLQLGAGVMFPLDNFFSFIGELSFKSEIDYSLLSGGIDYKLRKYNRIRGCLGFGLDDGAPDFSLRVSYLGYF